MWDAAPWRRLIIMSVICGVVAGLLFWWSLVDQSRRGSVFLIAIAAIFASLALGCLVLLVWHSTRRLWRKFTSA
jgi:apolipoprotein N-acyltransferase